MRANPIAKQLKLHRSRSNFSAQDFPLKQGVRGEISIIPEWLWHMPLQEVPGAPQSHVEADRRVDRQVGVAEFYACQADAVFGIVGRWSNPRLLLGFRNC